MEANIYLMMGGTFSAPCSKVSRVSL
jgi:hypothetical protein